MQKSTPIISIVYLLGALTSFGCVSVGGGESTPQACGNRIDDDDDDLEDCEDPDCHAFEVCRKNTAISRNTDAGSIMDGATPSNDASLDGGLASDAGAITDSGVADATVDPDDDAGVAPPACVPACADDEFCSAGVCRQVGAGQTGQFKVQILSATVPDATAIEQCLDFACDGRFSIPFAACSCPPETYVRVLHLRNGVSTVVGTTDVAEPSLEPSYSGGPFDVALEAGDVLTFEVYDSDAPFEDTLLYDCKPDLTAVAPGPIECSEMAGPAYLFLYTVRGEVTR